MCLTYCTYLYDRYCYLSVKTQKGSLEFIRLQIRTCFVCNLCLRPHVTLSTLWQNLWSNVATSHCFRLDLCLRLSTDCISCSSFKLLLNFVAEYATSCFKISYRNVQHLASKFHTGMCKVLLQNFRELLFTVRQI